MPEFDAKRARAKRPCPLWVDAFQRDTQHLQADEVGAYMLILMAMWTRESCDFPSDDSRLARVARVSTRLWKSRVGPVIMEFLEVGNGAVISQRLRKEAAYVERTVKQQSDRKRAEKPDKSLETLDVGSTTDNTMDEPRNYPTQQPNNPTEEDKSSSQEAAEYQNYLAVHPNPVDSDAGRSLFDRIVLSGVEPSTIIGAARKYAEVVKDWSGDAKVQQSDNFLDADRGKWRQFESKAIVVDFAKADEGIAATIKKGKAFLVTNITDTKAGELVAQGLVSDDECRAVGLKPTTKRLSQA